MDNKLFVVCKSIKVTVAKLMLQSDIFMLRKNSNVLHPLTDGNRGKCECTQHFQ